jgi:hypothetical protein
MLGRVRAEDCPVLLPRPCSRRTIVHTSGFESSRALTFRRNRTSSRCAARLQARRGVFSPEPKALLA